MILLDHLLNIAKLTVECNDADDRSAEAYAEGLYLTNKSFAAFADLAYRRSMVTRFPGGKGIPQYGCDNVPYGYHLSQLERQLNKFKVAAFNEYGSDRNLDGKIADRKLVQVFESVADIEQKFLRNVINKSIPWFGREAWKRAKHSYK